MYRRSATGREVRELCEVRLELEITACQYAIECNRATFTDQLSGVENMIAVYDVEHPALRHHRAR
jgi:hypothetical protein